MKYVLGAIFIISSIIHLGASLNNNNSLRAKSKWFIVSSLIGWYCFACHQFSIFVVLALFFSWLGDVLLIPKGIKWFALGGYAFEISHFLFIFCYSQNINFNNLNIWEMLIVALVFLIAAIVIFYYLQPHLPKQLFIPMFIYFSINGANNTFAFYQLISKPCFASFVCCVGAFLFFISDATLFFVRFNKSTRWKSHFPVMLTYIFAEFLIVSGLILFS